MLGTALQAMVLSAVWSYGKLAMRHNWWSEREEMGWPELVGIELEASAGARCVRQLRLEQAGEQNEQRGSNYVRVRVCWVGHCD